MDKVRLIPDPKGRGRINGLKSGFRCPEHSTETVWHFGSLGPFYDELVCPVGEHAVPFVTAENGAKVPYARGAKPPMDYIEEDD